MKINTNYKAFYDNSHCDCEILASLKKSRNLRYKVLIEGELFILKLFTHRTNQYEREKSFTDLYHKSIVSPIISGSIPIKTGQEMMILSNYCPNGDFHELIAEKKVNLTEKVVRTYFRQLFDAVKYLHEKEIAHLDIKLANIMLDENFNLKLRDFDISYRATNPLYSRGTPDYRAPEVVTEKTYNPYSADVFSLAIVLFVMLNCRTMPFMEKYPRLWTLRCNNHAGYWGFFENFLNVGQDFWSPEFKELFEGMTEEIPENRLKSHEIEASEWFRGEVCEPSELEQFMKSALGMEN